MGDGAMPAARDHELSGKRNAMRKYLPWLFVLQLCAVRLPAASLGVSPSGFIVHEIAPGRQYDVYRESGVRLTINNGDDSTHTYVLSSHRPSTRGRWEKGYLEIPDPKWCWFDRQEVTVGPHAKGYANLLLKVPDEEKYYNQRWAVTFGIEGKPGPLGIALAIDVRAQIETQSKADGRKSCSRSPTRGRRD
jgi:hypothetical protein